MTAILGYTAFTRSPSGGNLAGVVAGVHHHPGRGHGGRSELVVTVRPDDARVQVSGHAVELPAEPVRPA